MQLQSYVHRLMGMSRTGPDDALVIEPYSIGDVFQTLTLMDHVRRVHGVRRLHFMCRRRAARVISLFQNVDGVLLCEDIDEEKLALLAQTGWYAAQRNLFIVPPEMHMDGITRHAALDGLGVMPLKQKILGLPPDVQPVLPPAREAVVRAAHESAWCQGVRPGSVIIFNHAHTMKPMDPEVYRPLQTIFPSGVFFDGWSGAPEGWGRRLRMPLEQVPYFCDLAGQAICIRSGITELLSLSSARIHTLYPGGRWMADWFKDKAAAASLFRTWGIRDLGLNPRSLEKKLFIEDHDSPQAIATKILHAGQDAGSH